MSREYVKIAEAPQFVVQYPQCSTCFVDLEHDDGWVCPNCGTSWSSDANDGDRGELFESWSGEELEGEPISESGAADWAHYHESMARHKRWPKLFSEPSPPRSKS